MDFHGPDMDELNYRFIALGEGTLTPKLETSDDGEDFSVEKVFPEITAPGESINAYRAKKRYRRFKAVVSGSLEDVQIGIDSGRRYHWEEGQVPVPEASDDDGETETPAAGGSDTPAAGGSDTPANGEDQSGEGGTGGTETQTETPSGGG